MSNDSPHGAESGTVVVGADGSAVALAAALWAAESAERAHRPLHLVYGADLDRLLQLTPYESQDATREAGRALLETVADAVAARHPGLAVKKTFSRKAAAPALLAAVEPDDTLVVGHRGHGGFRSLLLGSVALTVAARCPVPVIVVRDQPGRPETGVVLAAVNAEGDTGWIGAAVREAQARKAALRLVGIWNPLGQAGGVVSMLDGLDALARRRVEELDAFADTLARDHPGLVVEADVRSSGSAAGALVEASGAADLLVVGGPDTRRHRPGGLGHVTHAVLHHAQCPVKVAPSADRT
ncbi:universal stress protein UspA [Streptomyces solincola]|uniref:Universal stress protein UspA n=1 Tax=Streptomyces solincola TaxID=2100817 RepID=A0A2S9Q270_9ACTN|nr:universal stress protein [Streptomyces solincola]PRH80769.1 universal stress protein UspA [Streptomyces solincola]